VGVVGDDVPVPEVGLDPKPELGVEPKPELGVDPKPVPVPFVPVPEVIDEADGPPPNRLACAFNCSMRGS